MVALLLGALVGLDVARRLVPMLIRDDLHAGDAAQHTWWLYRFADPELFPNDLAADYMSQLIFSPPAYQALFRVTAGLIDPQHMSEALAIALAVTSAALAASIGWRAAGSGAPRSRKGAGAGAVGAVIAYVAFGFASLHEGGFPRSFGLALLLAGMLAIITRRWAWLGAVFVACSLLYPPMVLNLAPVAGILFVAEMVHQFRSHKAQIEAERAPLMTRPRLAFILLGLLAAAIIANLYLRPLPADVGTFYTYAETRKMPEWRADGRSAFYRGQTAFYYHGPTSGIGLSRPDLMLALVLLGATLAFFHRAIRIEAWLLLLSAIAMWALAHALMFRLYLPSRYTTYALPVFAILWAGGLCREIWLIFPAAAVIRRSYFWIVAGAIALVPYGIWSVRATDAKRYDAAAWAQPAGYDAALRAIREMPRDILIASHPVDANAIPLRARRSVLVNNEVSIAYNRAYYPVMKQRLEASFQMLYAVDWRVVDRLADEFGVDLFLVNETRLRDPDANPYYAPFKSSNLPLIARGKEQRFVMLDVPLDRVVTRHGDVVLVRVGTRVTP